MTDPTRLPQMSRSDAQHVLADAIRSARAQHDLSDTDWQHLTAVGIDPAGIAGAISYRTPSLHLVIEAALTLGAHLPDHDEETDR